MRFRAVVAAVVLLVPPMLAAQASCPSPAPPAGLDPTSLADRARVLEYARGLGFHPAQSPTGDTRPLTAISTPGDPAQRRFRLTVTGATEPQVCAHRNTTAELNAGRVVARVTMSGAYDKLTLPQGVSYLWIDQVRDSTARGVIIPDNMGVPSRVVVVRLDTHPEYQRAFAESRWLFNPDDDNLWVVCKEGSCCEIIGGGP